MAFPMAASSWLRELAARRAERAFAAHKVAATPRINGRDRREL
jgi:hypothetical protein